MSTRGIAMLAGLLAVALIAAGCGGSSSESTSSITKEQFIKKVDGICQAGNDRMEVAFAAFLEGKTKVKKPSDADFEELVGKVVVPNLRREIREIRAIDAPSGDEDRVDAFVEAVEEGVETAEDNPTVVVRSSEAVFGISSRLAKEYGLVVCGSR